MTWPKDLTRLVIAAAVLFGLGCDGGADPLGDARGSDGGTGGPDGGGMRAPDTGAGAGATTPAGIDCVDFCLRAMKCEETLCNEDTQSTRFTPAIDHSADLCQIDCAGVSLAGVFTAAEWSCLFQSSCRQVFDYDDCRLGAYYTCQ